MRRLYVVAASLLVVHEIDAAHWREWDLFRVPGGLPVFLLVHVALLPALFLGHAQVVAGTRAGTWASVAVGAAGVLAAAIHGTFLALGSGHFRSPSSVAVLAGALVASVLLLREAARALRSGQAGVPPRAGSR